MGISVSLNRRFQLNDVRSRFETMSNALRNISRMNSQNSLNVPRRSGISCNPIGRRITKWVDVAVDALRVAMFCPYSLSIPGGVQSQVLGLAHALRRIGHEVRVLGPCDGPPPASFVTPLGDSLPTAANGSVAPLAPTQVQRFEPSERCVTSSLMCGIT